MYVGKIHPQELYKDLLSRINTSLIVFLLNDITRVKKPFTATEGIKLKTEIQEEREWRNLNTFLCANEANPKNLEISPMTHQW